MVEILFRSWQQRGRASSLGRLSVSLARGAGLACSRNTKDASVRMCRCWRIRGSAHVLHIAPYTLGAEEIRAVARSLVRPEGEATGRRSAKKLTLQRLDSVADTSCGPSSRCRVHCAANMPDFGRDAGARQGVADWLQPAARHLTLCLLSGRQATATSPSTSLIFGQTNTASRFADGYWRPTDLRTTWKSRSTGTTVPVTSWHARDDIVAKAPPGFLGCAWGFWCYLRATTTPSLTIQRHGWRKADRRKLQLKRRPPKLPGESAQGSANLFEQFRANVNRSGARVLEIGSRQVVRGGTSKRSLFTNVLTPVSTTTSTPTLTSSATPTNYQSSLAANLMRFFLSLY